MTLSHRSPKQAAIQTVLSQLSRRGFELRRHPGARRQQLFESHDVNLVLDVGAALGHYAHELRNFGYRGEIVSFEPLSAAFRHLAAETTADPSWTARNVALGEQAGTASINVASNSDSSSLLPMLENHRDAAPDIAYMGTEEITVSTLDAEFPEEALAGKRAFLKIDTQGYEAKVLRGGARFLKACSGLQLELSFTPLYEGGLLVHQALELTHDLGFTLVGFQQGFAAATGEVLQADGIFFRTSTTG